MRWIELRPTLSVACALDNVVVAHDIGSRERVRHAVKSSNILKQNLLEILFNT